MAVRVLEEEADAGQRARAQLLVDLGRVRDREDPRHQRRHVDLLAGDQVDEALEIAALGPADVAGRVVDALQLVPVVVPAGAVGPGEPDVEFLVVVRVPGQVELGLADVDDPGPVAGQPGRRLDRSVGRAAGGEQDVVGAETVAHPEQSPFERRDPCLVGRANRRSRRPSPPSGSGRRRCRYRTPGHRPRPTAARRADRPGRARSRRRCRRAGPPTAGRRASRSRRPSRRRPAPAVLRPEPVRTGSIGIQLYSACKANSLPAAATSWPTLNSSAPRPTSTTTPHSE